MSYITSWEIDGETVETVADFIFLGSKVIADGDCSHEMKRNKIWHHIDEVQKLTHILKNVQPNESEK